MCNSPQRFLASHQELCKCDELLYYLKQREEGGQKETEDLG